MSSLIGKFSRFKNKIKTPPQLRMVFPESLSLPEHVMLPKGFKCREYRDEDKNKWLNLMTKNGQLGHWDIARLEHILLDQPVYSSQYFVFIGNKLVAFAVAYIKSKNEMQCYEIGWIATDPNYSRKGLGAHVIVRAIRNARARKQNDVFLLTDDFRIPAISLYLKIGFRPSRLYGEATVARWKNIVNQLDDHGAKKLKYIIDGR